MTSRPPRRRAKMEELAAPRMSDLVSNNPLGLEEGAAVSAFSKASHVYAVLRREILDGMHPPGSWLRLTALAGRLGLSAMPVREALRLLEKDGLVIMHLHRGAQVASLSFELALEVTEVRMQLERYAALLALPLHSAETLADVERALADMAQQVTNPVRFAIGNRAFSTAVLEPGANGFLKRHIQRLWDQNWQYSSTAVFEVMRHRIAGSLRENTEILRCLRSHDGGGLGEVYDHRLRQSVAAWRLAIERTRPAPSAREAADSLG